MMHGLQTWAAIIHIDISSYFFFEEYTDLEEKEKIK